jgi:hypothetical protein
VDVSHVEKQFVTWAVDPCAVYSVYFYLQTCLSCSHSRFYRQNRNTTVPNDVRLFKLILICFPEHSLCIRSQYTLEYRITLYILTLSIIWHSKSGEHNVSETGSIYLSIFPSLFSLCEPWSFFSFLISTESVGLLGRRISPSQGCYLNTGQCKRQNKRTQYRHACFEWDSNPRSQCLRGRSQ